jgi:molybdopterin converting factor small subunit
MQVEFQLEAQLRTAAGLSRVTLDVADSATLLAALQALAAHVGEPAASHVMTDSGVVRPGLLVLVNESPADADEAAQLTLSNGDKVFLMPPIAGG